MLAASAMPHLAGHAQTALAQGWVRASKRIFDNAKVSDHFAIIPTLQASGVLSEAEQKKTAASFGLSFQTTLDSSCCRNKGRLATPYQIGESCQPKQGEQRIIFLCAEIGVAQAKQYAQSGIGINFQPRQKAPYPR